MNYNTDVNIGTKNKWTPLHSAAFKGEREIASLFLDDGANVNAANEQGKTPLHLVSRGDYRHGVGIAELFLERGANPNARNKDYVTPLQLASDRWRLDIASLRVLLDYNAKAHPENDQDRSTDMIAQNEDHAAAPRHDTMNVTRLRR